MREERIKSINAAVSRPEHRMNLSVIQHEIQNRPESIQLRREFMANKQEEWRQKSLDQWTDETYQSRHATGMRNAMIKRAGWKPIICLETGQQYDLISEAAKDMNVSRHAINTSLKRGSSTAGGWSFRYVDTINRET